MPNRQRSCVVYRASQKKLAREFLLQTRTLLGQEMQKLHQLFKDENPKTGQ